MTPDQINAMFEFGGAIAISASIRQIIKDKCYAGVSLWNVVFFVSWGSWNVIYYPKIGQPWSFYGGCTLTLANAFYIGCLLWFPHRTKE